MKKYLSFSTLCLSAIVCFSSCSSDKNDEPTPPAPPIEEEFAYEFELRMTDNGFKTGESTTFVPGFKTGDKAGLYIVKDGAIVADNIELTYNGKIWKTATPAKAAGGDLFVYAPYNASATALVTPTASTAADFFGRLDDNITLPADQKDFDTAIRPYDIVIAKATATGSKTNLNTVVLTAAADHMLSLTSWSLPGGTAYTTSTGFRYTTPGSATATAYTLDGAAAVPSTAAGVDAFFHTAGSASKLEIEYTDGETADKSEVSLADSKAGELNIVKIGAGAADGGKRDLQVGDIYYRDGSILPVETAAGMKTVPAGVAGFIFNVDPARFSEREKELGKNHAHVISAKMGLVKSKDYFPWQDAYPVSADDGAGRFFDHVESEDFPGLVLPIIGDTESRERCYEMDNNDLDGLRYNEILRERRSDEIAAGYYQCMTAIDWLNENVAVPSSTTGWFLPSMGQLLDLLRNVGKVDTNLSLLEADPSDGYVGELNYTWPASCSPSVNANFERAMSKFLTKERDRFVGSENALWSSSYSPAYNFRIDAIGPRVRQMVTANDIVLNMSYDIIGKGNVRGVLAF